jgi:glutamate/tyrosine decarboxylase-like PLP-dependent enzyme
MNSLKLWLTLKVHGRMGYEELISRQMRLARQLEKLLLASGEFTQAGPGVLPILNLQLKGDADVRSILHRAFVTEVTNEGQYWLSTTRVQGESVVRLMIISYLTEERHVQALAARMVTAAKLVQARAAVRA